MSFAQLFGQFHATHARHHDVGEQQIKWGHAACQEQRLVAVARGLDLIARGGEHSLDEAADGILVLDHEDDLVATCRHRSTGPRFIWLHGFGGAR